MTIYFLTRQPDVCQLLADRFATSGNVIRIFPLITKLSVILKENDSRPDILFIDYFLFLSGTFDAYQTFSTNGEHFPIVCYNHPYPIPQKRKFFWTKMLLDTGYFSDISNIEPLLTIMDEALKDPEIYPYVSGIQQPAPYRSTNLRYIEPLSETEIEYYINTFDNVITDSLLNKKRTVPSSVEVEVPLPDQDKQFLDSFNTKHRLSHQLSKIFSYLYSHKDTQIPIEKIKNYMSSAKGIISTNSIRLQIYRLRNILKEDAETDLKIISFNYGYMLTNK